MASRHSDMDRRRILGAGLALPLVSARSGRAQAAESLVGPHEVVTLDRMEIVDEVGARAIPTRAFFPKEPGRYPGIIFSHGFGGSFRTFPNTGAFWASHGYVVLHPTHMDSLQFPDPRVDPSDAAVMREFLAARGNLDPATRQAFVEVLNRRYFLTRRLDDVSCLLRLLTSGGGGLNDILRDRTDTRRLGMSGHSFGGYTTLICAEASLTPALDHPLPSGFSSFMMMSGQGPGRMGLTEDSFAKLRSPFMATTGTRDFGADGETPPWRLKPYDLSPPGSKYAVVVDGFRHMDFDPALDQAMPVKGADRLRQLQIAFWDATLKSDRKALDFLNAAADLPMAAEGVRVMRR